MGADDVNATLDIALAASGCTSVIMLHKPLLLSDNGPCYIAGDLAKYLEKNRIDHVRGAPNHPQTQVRSSAGTVVAPLHLIQFEVDSGPTERTRDEVQQVHRRADHRHSEKA